MEGTYFYLQYVMTYEPICTFESFVGAGAGGENTLKIWTQNLVEKRFM